MKRKRVIAIGLDGLELNLAERLMAAGEMPKLAALRDRSARFRLDHGPAQRTGLAWEHVASGLSPDAARRWAAVEFDPSHVRCVAGGRTVHALVGRHGLSRRRVRHALRAICGERATPAESWVGGRTIPA